MKRLFIMLLCLCAWSAHAAQDIQPFVRGSAKAIAAAYPGKPYILAFWSLTCSHCREELAQLGELLQKNPGAAVVLVSTDSPAEAGEIAAVLAENRLESAQAWVFADSFAERLRADVDKKWRGELPRTYFYNRMHQPTAHSGKLSAVQLADWLQGEGQ